MLLEKHKAKIKVIVWILLTISIFCFFASFSSCYNHRIESEEWHKINGWRGGLYAQPLEIRKKFELGLILSGFSFLSFVGFAYFYVRTYRKEKLKAIEEKRTKELIDKINARHQARQELEKRLWK